MQASNSLSFLFLRRGGLALSFVQYKTDSSLVDNDGIAGMCAIIICTSATADNHGTKYSVYTTSSLISSGKDFKGFFFSSRISGSAMFSGGCFEFGLLDPVIGTDGKQRHAKGLSSTRDKC